MKKTIILLIFGFGLPFFTHGQEARFKFLGERTDDVIRLAWLPEVWSEKMTGVVIKRRTGDDKWHDVTSKSVIPASYEGKDLSNVEQSAAERERLNEKLVAMITAGKGKPMTEEAYTQKILHDQSKLSGIALIFAIDYDLMLLNGFGCTDRQVTTGRDYEYGLFPVMGKKVVKAPVATYISRANDQPEYTLKVETEAEVLGKNKYLRLHWRFDLNKFREQEIKGFNIYQRTGDRESTLVNQQIIWITSDNNPVDLSYQVDFPDQPTNYFAVPVSFFGTEGSGYKLAFQPAAYKITVPAPQLTFTLNKQNLELNWLLDHGYDSLISQYKVMKKPAGKEYQQQEMLTTSTRSFTELMDETGEKARYKIIAVTRIGRAVWSNEVNITYLPANAILSAENLQGKIINKDGVYYIRLTWDYPNPDSDLEFRLFTKGPSGNLIWDSSYPKDIKSPFDIEVKRSKASLERFAIQVRTIDKRQSLLSNEIEILTPSRYFPPISITGLTLENNNAKVTWKFSEGVLDLAGFRIIVDDAVYLTEKEVAADLREYGIKGLPSGKHDVNIIAVSQFGLEKVASKRSIVIP